MDEKKHQENIEPLEESDLMEEFNHEILTRDKEALKALNKKIHEGGEPELPPEPEQEPIEDYPST